MIKKSSYSILLRLSFFFFSFLLVYSLLIGYVFIRSSINYEKEVNEKLNKDIAFQIVKDASPFLNGRVSENKVQDLMHYLMTVNPSIEIYVLNGSGDILTYMAPNKVVQLKKVSVLPILKFIESKGNEFIQGDDPRNPGKLKVFSAAPVLENNKILGYVYVILASQEYDGIASSIQNSSFLQLTLKSFLMILIISFLIAFVIFWITTKNLSHIIDVFRNYKSGDMKSRIALPLPNTEYTIIEKTFNEMADSLEQKMTQIHEIDNLRKELIANISHDLRTPVASISGYTELLIDKNDTINSADRIKYLAIIDTNSKKMGKQIQDLFDLSKLESAHYKLLIEPLHLGELVADIADKYKLLANKKGVHLNTIFSKNLPLIQADIALMDRAIQNLVENALKFSATGSTINIEIGQAPDKIIISVSDTGIGISEPEIPFIFDRYKIGKKNTENSTGLGLAIVKKIIELHKAAIHVLSKENSGTTFTIEIPV
jgi:signal transduction histidine kinase